MPKQNTSSRRALGTTLIIGSASFVNVLLDIVKVKVLSVLLGPAGMGLAATLATILNSAGKLAAMGLDQSAVPQIANARVNDEKEELARVLMVFRLLTVLFSVLGATLILVFQESIAMMVFADRAKGRLVAWLALGVAISVLGGSLGGVLVGFRKVEDIARVKVFSGLVLLLLTVSSVTIWGESGIIVYVVSVPIVGCLFTWNYAHKIKITSSCYNLRYFFSYASPMIKIGFPLMSSGFLHLFMTLMLQSTITKEYGLKTTGIFGAAWALSFVYMNFMLNAMATDYFPRLCEVVEDSSLMVKIINEQMHLSLTLSLTMIIGMLTFAPILINVFYTQEFSQSAVIIQWMALGNLFKVVAWPLGFAFLAKKKIKLFLLAEILWSVVFYGGCLLALKFTTIEVVGYLFVVSYALALGLYFFLLKKLINYQPTRTITQLFLWALFACILILGLTYISISLSYLVGGLAVTIAARSLYKELWCIYGDSPFGILKKKVTKFSSRNM